MIKIDVNCEFYKADGSESNEIIKNSCSLNYSLKDQAKEDNSNLIIFLLIGIYSFFSLIEITVILILIRKNRLLTSQVEKNKENEENNIDRPPNYNDALNNNNSNQIESGFVFYFILKF